MVEFQHFVIIIIFFFIRVQHFVIMRLKKNNKQKNTMRKNQMSNKY